MAWMLNRETGKYSHYDSQIGDIVEWEGEEGYEDLGNEGEDWQDEGEDWQDEGELDFSRSPRQERTPRTFLRRAEPRSLHPRPRQ